MLSYVEHPLRNAMQQARDAGMDQADMHSMVTDIYSPNQPNGSDPTPASDLVYDELPDGLMDLPAAAKKYNCKMGYRRSMVQHDRIKPMDRIKAPARGGYIYSWTKRSCDNGSSTRAQWGDQKISTSVDN